MPKELQFSNPIVVNAMREVVYPRAFLRCVDIYILIKFLPVIAIVQPAGGLADVHGNTELFTYIVLIGDGKRITELQPDAMVWIPGILEYRAYYFCPAPLLVQGIRALGVATFPFLRKRRLRKAKNEQNSQYEDFFRQHRPQRYCFWRAERGG